MEAFTNDYDFITMDDQESHYLHMGFGVIDSTVKSQSQLPAQNQNASLNKALTQDNILELFQHSSGTLDSKDLPNQASAVNSQIPITCTRSMDTLMSNKELARIQAELEDPTASISSLKDYCNKDGDKTYANTMTDQVFEDIWNILEKDQNEIVGFSENQETQEVSCGFVGDSQIPLPVHDMTKDNTQKPNSNVSLTMNTVNQSGGGQVGIKFASSNFLTKHGATLSPINQGNSEDRCQFPQLINSMSAMNSIVTVEGNMPFQNSTVMLNSNDLPNVASAVNQNMIHVTWPNLTDYPNQTSALTPQTSIPCSQNTGPMKTKSKSKRAGKVGRCPQGVLPLYLQPEPENEEDKRTWNRAKTAHKHRENKKNTLVNDANTIKDLMNEMNELKSQLKVVTTERDTYKNTLNEFVNNGPRY